MNKFRYVGLKTDKNTKPLTPKTFEAIMTDAYVISHCDAARKAKQEGDMKAYEANKSQLPMIFWCGFNSKGLREQEHLTPSQYYIMDIDHAKMSGREIFADIQEKTSGRESLAEGMPYLNSIGIRIAHETPSGGLRLVCRAVKDFANIAEHQKWMAEELQLSQYGNVDEVVKDLSRGSFMVKHDWLIYYDKTIWDEDTSDGPIKASDTQKDNADKGDTKRASNLPEITNEQLNFEFEGTRVADIANEYIIDMGGVPAEGKRHGFYNELVKNFRNICESDPRIVFAVLPLCEGTPEKRWSQCTSICKTNTTTRIPKDFYMWMLKRGYVKSKKYSAILEYMDSEVEKQPELPPLPPVFREYCSICPPDFIYPTIVALLPIMGTLTSYARGSYIDNSEQSTTFFSCIWAPPSSGKGFVVRMKDQLMKKIQIRDEMNTIREQLWLVDENTRPKDEKGKDLPHVMVRIMPAINSLPEFLEKMRDNKGYHMFTMAEEVDTFKKGSSSGGSDKSDLFRTAWDNSLYGQSFKSTNTFKGQVRIYYNILLTGTPGAVKKYYSNVEDGMVTRISICEIENQQFAKFVPWKKLTTKQMQVIDKFVERCDQNTYYDDVEMTSEDINTYNTNSDEYDKNVKWRFRLKPKQEVNMEFIYPTILNWLEKTRVEASLDNDAAADVFRRRCAVKGFRVALLCTCCWAQVRHKEQDIICKFVEWFMNRDLRESLKMFGEKYNKMNAEAYIESSHHQGLFDTLGDEFTKNDVIAQCMKQGVHSKVKTIIWRWKKDRVIDKIGNDRYKKIKKNAQN